MLCPWRRRTLATTSASGPLHISRSRAWSYHGTSALAFTVACMGSSHCCLPNSLWPLLRRATAPLSLSYFRRCVHGGGAHIGRSSGAREQTHVWRSTHESSPSFRPHVQRPLAGLTSVAVCCHHAPFQRSTRPHRRSGFVASGPRGWVESLSDVVKPRQRWSNQAQAWVEPSPDLVESGNTSANSNRLTPTWHAVPQISAMAET